MFAIVFGRISKHFHRSPGPVNLSRLGGSTQNNHAFKQPLNQIVWILIRKPNII